MTQPPHDAEEHTDLTMASQKSTRPSPEERRESGLPGGGAGRRDEIGHTGVYPLSHSEGASGDAPVEAEGAFGQGERGIEGYYDSGGSEIIPDERITEEREQESGS